MGPCDWPIGTPVGQLLGLVNGVEHPDFAKNIQSLTTRVNKKKSKKKKTSDYIPPAVKEVEEEEILAIEATVDSNITNKPRITIEANMANVSPKHVSFY
jgi:hypothetical protein